MPLNPLGHQSVPSPSITGFDFGLSRSQMLVSTASPTDLPLPSWGGRRLGYGLMTPLVKDIITWVISAPPASSHFSSHSCASPPPSFFLGPRLLSSVRHILICNLCAQTVGSTLHQAAKSLLLLRRELLVTPAWRKSLITLLSYSLDPSPYPAAPSPATRFRAADTPFSVARHPRLGRVFFKPLDSCVTIPCEAFTTTTDHSINLFAARGSTYRQSESFGRAPTSSCRTCRNHELQAAKALARDCRGQEGRLSFRGHHGPDTSCARRQGTQGSQTAQERRRQRR